MRKAITTVAAGVFLALSSQPLMAVGFGRLVNATSLGQSLDVSVALSADIAEQITSECIGAEVVVGDSVLPRPAVQVRLEPPADNGMRLLRVTTTQRIHEPVVNLTVSVACPSRVSRQFVVFVDPPLTAYEPAVAMAVEPAAALPGSASAALDSLPRMASRGSDDSAARSGALAPPPEPPVTRPARRTATSSAAKATSTRAALKRASRAAARKARRGSSLDARARATPRLQLERGAGSLVAASIAASAAAAAELSALMPTQAASSPAVLTEAERTAELQAVAIASLQQQIEKLKIESDVSSKSIAQLQTQLKAAETSRSSGWLGYALGAVGAALLLWIGLLIGRRASASRPGASWWGVEPVPATPAAVDTPPNGIVRPMPSVPEVAESADETQTTDPVPLVMKPSAPAPESDTLRKPQVFGDTVASVGAALTVAPAPTSRLTADELIDLEQQAEFFVALDQDDSAVDLLNAFLRGPGGASPLPYLKLLEIHHRRGEREAYERIRERQQRRFGALPGGWGDVPAAPRGIEDHADPTRQIVSAWADPAEAMRLIESLLVDGDRVAVSFDLATLGDLQFLYQLARSARELDLDLDRPAEAAVDLLLPLSHADDVRSVVNSAFSTPSDIDLELDFTSPHAEPKSRV